MIRQTFNEIDTLQNDILDASSEILLNDDSALVGILDAADRDGVVEIESDERSLGDTGHTKTVHGHGDVLGLALDDHVVPLVVIQ